MQPPLTAILVAVALSLGTAYAEQPSAPAFKVGVAKRQFAPPSTYEWRGDPKHTLSVVIWYPAAPAAQQQILLIGAPGRPLFDGGRAAANAALAPTPAKFPLIALSHGTGGTAESLAWLGTALASTGHVVAAVDHPGNNAVDGYTVPGFTLWWERARDLSVVIDHMLADAAFGSRIDRQRIGAAGFSLGGYTVIALAGGITSLSRFRSFCGSPDADGMCKPPPEFPDLRARSEALAKTDAAYRAALTEDSRSYRDPRVSAILAMAPALVPALTMESLAKIHIPVAIAAGLGDEIVPIGSGAKAAAARIPHAALTLFHAPAGHYVFTATCTEAGRAVLPTPCNDPPGVDRDAIHAETARLAQAFFARHLR